MKVLFSCCRLYFLLILLYAVIGGFYLAWSGKSDALFFFNANRSPQLDDFFRFATKTGEEYLYVLLALVFIFRRRRREALLVALTGLAVMAVSSSTKAMFGMDRPLAVLRKENLEHLLNPVADVVLHSGATSFPSGHTMSAFALATITVLLLKNRPWISLVFFFCAFLVAISRVYLFQHFWMDVYAGGLVGVAVAIIVYGVHNRFRPL